jgi:capsular polysaccharide biosynthesis protein
MEFGQLLRLKRRTLISIFFIFLIAGGIVSGIQGFKYGTKSSVLVIQEGGAGVDPFAVSRSVEYLSTLLSQVVYSNSFFNHVMDTDFNIDKSYFTNDSTKQMEIWKKTVSAKSVENSGIITVSVYHLDQHQAKQIALAVNHVLMTSNSEYQGLGSSVKISVIDQPIVSNYPVKPNLLLNFTAVLLATLVVGFVYIYLFPEEKYNLDWFASKPKPKKVATPAYQPAPPAYQAPVQSAPPTPTPATPAPVTRPNPSSFEDRGNISNLLP